MGEKNSIKSYGEDRMKHRAAPERSGAMVEKRRKRKEKGKEVHFHSEREKNLSMNICEM